MRSILIVEDNSALVEILHEMLTSKLENFTVTTVLNGNEAISAIESRHPDLILMDIKLPGENGLQLTQKIKKRYPDIRIIVNSNYDFPEYKKAAYQFGADYFFSKETGTSDEIIELIRSLFGAGDAGDQDKTEKTQGHTGDPVRSG